MSRSMRSTMPRFVPLAVALAVLALLDLSADETVEPLLVAALFSVFAFAAFLLPFAALLRFLFAASCIRACSASQVDQLDRRHLSESQRAMVAAKLANLSNGKHSSANLQSTSRAEAAEKLNVSERTVNAAKKVQTAYFTVSERVAILAAIETHGQGARTDTKLRQNFAEVSKDEASKRASLGNKETARQAKPPAYPRARRTGARSWRISRRRRLPVCRSIKNRLWMPICPRRDNKL